MSDKNEETSNKSELFNFHDAIRLVESYARLGITLGNALRAAELSYQPFTDEQKRELSQAYADEEQNYFAICPSEEERLDRLQRASDMTEATK